VEKRLRKIYKIEETIGKSLLNDEDNEDELNEEDKKSLNNDENNSNKPHEDNSAPMETTKTHSSKSDIDADLSINNQTSPSPSKSNLSPGEIKPISPSSLSEASLISN
jgi:hypothetical protein